jgi:hypothetical protein
MRGPHKYLAYGNNSVDVIILLSNQYTTFLRGISDGVGAEVAVPRPRTTLLELPLIMNETGFLYFIALSRVSWRTEWKSVVSSNLNRGDNDCESKSKQDNDVLQTMTCGTTVPSRGRARYVS